jgi:HD superfamily phosphohydrolase
MDCVCFKIINDSIYGQISFHSLLMTIISTKEFSRLKNLKQLGIVNYVYPCANNTRFEHSIGYLFIIECT